MDTLQQIYQACSALQKQNKTPSVALLKARLAAGTPLAVIIKGLQAWQKNPALGDVALDPRKEQTTDATQDPLDKRISEAIRPLQQQIDALSKQIDELKKQRG
ncbi:hypothetical protein QWY77_07440 [Thalassotalea ponticola]|uniref:hypothetical protein n=1 Tax=Thalassotalea ponticola TaxID=1523392 RepID=UPI0025B44A5E|nr:hypothetical protein [Thalassotalea ponticola]MDN3652595.1 hypothetical protein [Thalassotalea ponticola]